MEYPKPNTDPGYRASVQECIDRAQRALEIGEVNLDTITDLFNTHKDRVTFADLIAHGDARIRLGIAWGDLATWKHMAEE